MGGRSGFAWAGNGQKSARPAAAGSPALRRTRESERPTTINIDSGAVGPREACKVGPAPTLPSSSSKSKAPTSTPRRTSSPDLVPWTERNRLRDETRRAQTRLVFFARRHDCGPRRRLRRELRPGPGRGAGYAGATAGLSARRHAIVPRVHSGRGTHHGLHGPGPDSAEPRLPRRVLDPRAQGKTVQAQLSRSA